jgi:transcriptional regulator
MNHSRKTFILNDDILDPVTSCILIYKGERVKRISKWSVFEGKKRAKFKLINSSRELILFLDEITFIPIL